MSGEPAPPPATFADAEDRRIRIAEFGEGPFPDGAAERAALVEMYATFDPADRAQGVPPSREDDVREWVDGLLANGVNVLAWHGERVAGHATLVPGGEGGVGGDDPHELAIFVHQEYQRAGIGSRLIRGLLGAARERGVDRIWLTVERWNEPAIALYRNVGFEPTDEGGFELEMSLELN
ncbi:MAG: N-acetyltransferase family protein [Halobacteriales archaeon]